MRRQDAANGYFIADKPSLNSMSVPKGSWNTANAAFIPLALRYGLSNLIPASSNFLAKASNPTTSKPILSNALPFVGATVPFACSNTMLEPGMSATVSFPRFTISAPIYFAYHASASATFGTTILIVSAAIGAANDLSSLILTLILSGDITYTSVAVPPGNGLIADSAHFASDAFRSLTERPMKSSDDPSDPPSSAGVAGFGAAFPCACPPPTESNSTPGNLIKFNRPPNCTGCPPNACQNLFAASASLERKTSWPAETPALLGAGSCAIVGSAARNRNESHRVCIRGWCYVPRRSYHALQSATRYKKAKVRNVAMPRFCCSGV